MSEVNISKLQNAFNQFMKMYEYYKQPLNYSDEMAEEARKEALVQRFEYTIDTFWKILKKYIEQTEEIELIPSPKSVMREAASLKILDAEVWIKFVSIRNKASHTYNEETLEEVLKCMDDFAEHGAKLLKYLEDNLNNE